MTKKTVTLILLFVIFFSVIAMAVWGKVPETSSDIYVTGLVFRDSEGKEITTINESDAKEKKVVLKRDLDKTLDYVFQVEILPANATDLRLNYQLQYGKATIEALPYQHLDATTPAPEEAPKNVHTFHITFTEQDLTTISFETNLSGTRYVRDKLMFAFEGARHSDVIIL